MPRTLKYILKKNFSKFRYKKQSDLHEKMKLQNKINAS